MAAQRGSRTQAVERPEIGRRLDAGGLATNVHVAGDGPPVLLIHGSGPGVSAWANWRLTLPVLAEQFTVVAPDLVGFGFTDRPAGQRYGLDIWVQHTLAVMDALGMPKASIVGNSMGGAVALRLASRFPERVEQLVLMGSVGVPFTITPALDAVWGYKPSVAAMRALLAVFAYDQALVNDDLAQLRYQASIEPGVQEAFAAMFPAPRQRWVDALCTPDEDIAEISASTLLIHGRDDQVIPLATSLHLLQLIPRAQLHVFGQCGHWTQIERAEEFTRLVSGFLRPAAAERS